MYKKQIKKQKKYNAEILKNKKIKKFKKIKQTVHFCRNKKARNYEKSIKIREGYYKYNNK